MNLIPSIRPNEIAQHRWSVASLLLVNLLPVVGVLGFGWRAFDVVFVYWLENVVIGVVNLLKILTCWPNAEAMANETPGGTQLRDPAAETAIADLVDRHGAGAQAAMQASKLFFAPFFAVHYGGFCVGHGVFVCVLLGEGGPMRGGSPFDLIGEAFQGGWLWLTAAGLLVSHLVSYFTNFLGRGEYRRTAPPLQMFAPYARIVVLHIAIVLSGFFVIILGQPVVLLLLLVAGKTLLDLAMHLREHRSPEEPHRVE